MAHTPPLGSGADKLKSLSSLEHSGSAPSMQTGGASGLVAPMHLQQPEPGMAGALSPETDDGSSVDGFAAEKRVVPPRLQQMREKMERMKQERLLRKQRQRQMVSNPADEERKQPRSDNSEQQQRRRQDRGMHSRYDGNGSGGGGSDVGGRRGDGGAYGYGRRDNRNFRNNVRHSGGGYGGGAKPRRKLKPLYLRKEEEYKAKMEAKEQQKVQVYNQRKKQRQCSMPTAEELREHRRECDERRRAKQAAARARALERKSGWENKARMAKMKHKKNARERHASGRAHERNAHGVAEAEALPSVERRVGRHETEAEATLNAKTLTDAETSEALEMMKQTATESQQVTMRIPDREAPEFPAVGPLKSASQSSGVEARDTQFIQPELTPEQARRLPVMSSAAPATSPVEGGDDVRSDNQIEERSPDKLIDTYFTSVSEKLKELGRKGTKEREEKKFLESTPPTGASRTNELSAAVARSGIAPPLEMLGLGANAAESHEAFEPPIQSADQITPLDTAINRIPVKLEVSDSASGATS